MVKISFVNSDVKIHFFGSFFFSLFNMFLSCIYQKFVALNVNLYKQQFFGIFECFLMFSSNSSHCYTKMFNCVQAGYISELEQLH